MKKNLKLWAFYVDVLRKPLRIMRFSLFLFIMSIFQAQAISGFAQKTEISLNFKNASVATVLSKIEENSNFYFLCNRALVDLDRTISIQVDNQLVENILAEIFNDTDVKYVITGRQIVLTSGNSNLETLEGSQSQQLRSISGKVTDSSGSPLPGVSVVIKGTSQGGITDTNGNYSISNVPANAILIFSFVGMSSQEIKVDDKTVINVSMTEHIVGLDEVVAVGYGKQSRAVVTTSVSKLDNKVLANVPYSNIGSALEGNLAGVRVQSNSGQPGAAPLIIIRGGTSINNPDGATPLYIVDGILRNNLDGINSADIESIQVLKDASSTAIYGARGSNGVVIVITKSGAGGPTRVTYNYDLSFSQLGKKLDLLNARDYVYFSRLGLNAVLRTNPSWGGLLTVAGCAGGIGNDLTNNTWDSVQKLTPENQHKLQEGWESMPDPLDPSTTLIFSNTDWQDVTFRTALTHNHSLSVSGGNERATFSLGLGYLNAQGIAISTDYDRMSLNLHGDLKVTDNIKAFAQVAYTNSNNHQVFSPGALLKASLILAPTAKRYFEDGTLSPGEELGYGNTEYTTSIFKPLNNVNDLTLVVGAQWKIIPGLTFDPRISLYQRNAYNRNFQESYLDGPNTLNTSREASAGYSRQYNPQAEAVITYNKSFNNLHNIEVKAGFSYYGTNNYSISANGKNAATDIIPTLNASGTPTSVSGSEGQGRIIGYFSRATYNFKEKYLFNASMRYDGASVLGNNNKWGLFPGISLGWNMHKEDFWTMFPKDLLTLKLRASYGVNGNVSGIGLYDAQGGYSTGTRYASLAGIQSTRLPNENLKWEQSKTLNFGTDIGLFNTRASILFDVYRRVTDNLLTNLNMPPSTGFTSILTNYGSLENKGCEIELKVRALPATSAFQWNISANVAKVKTKILKLPYNGIENNRVGGQYLWDPKQGKYAWLGGLQEGGAIGDYYVSKQVSIYKTDAEAAAGPIDMLVPRSTDKTKYGGDVNWLDVDKNDTIDSRDRVYGGNRYPNVTGGFTNSFSYKNINLEIGMDYTLGHTINYQLGARIEGNFSAINALGSNILRSWQKPGDVTDIPRYYFADVAQLNVSDSRACSRFYPKGDFLCLRKITLSYNIPHRVIQTYKITDLRFYVTGSNLIYFTKYPGLNPEATGTDTAYPNPRTITFGASITF